MNKTKRSIVCKSVAALSLAFTCLGFYTKESNAIRFPKLSPLKLPTNLPDVTLGPICGKTSKGSNQLPGGRDSIVLKSFGGGQTQSSSQNGPADPNLGLFRLVCR
ncbi:hypothetical protein [Candidatus Arthromitus sp. SFB-rat-Yit]|uniref:hypothetical protein n=1 Tax=Candidatus Arthromitus sp. SFB-rat-Yit TaxID=1041504 RepID=UPI000227A067|nr:hypothetical protein [Candidatus Arthromitus sp. SFB-rat-Yit]BAK81202.1 hypothetical protein RATSFB_0640 [Candidatus Arthromitus sp. SFB-rat-Yit]